MKELFAITLLAASLVAAEGLAPSSQVEKMVQQEESIGVELSLAASTPEVEQDEISQEVALILQPSQPEIAPSSSLEGLVEKQTAHLIEENLVAEAPEKELVPQHEDLGFIAANAEQPAVVVVSSGYESLPISAEEKQKIATIIVTMADNNGMSLLFERKHLEKLGDEVNHVHPIRFLGTIFSDPRLVHCMHKIRRSNLKWNGFIKGFSVRFKEEIESKNMHPYLPGLANSLGIKAEDLQPYVQSEDLEGMMNFLLDRNVGVANANPPGA